ncbi:MAG: hypothetical protein Q4B48_01195 [Syntrophomonadaceae bacterium]|nr:hypothetical protein [Syntrophomonadaceae bacterium]
MVILKHLGKFLLLAMVGGALYYMLELLARGFSHYSMFITGGLCFVMIGMLNEFYHWDMALISQMFVSAIIITTLELLAGLIVNIGLDMNVWDYSKMPYNFLGQICLVYSVLWFFLSPAAIFLDDVLRWRCFDEEFPRYRLL